MKLIVLGSGTCVPSLTRSAPGYLLMTSGMQVLIDMGSTALQQLTRAGKNYLEVDAIFITHTHVDHISGLLPFMQASTSNPGNRRTKSLSIIGPPGIKNFYDCCILACMGEPKSFPVSIMEMREDIDLEPLKVKMVKTVHTAESLAFRFSDNNRSVVFTGDCDFDDDLIAFSRAADLLVIDCSFPDSMKVPGHLIPRECGVVAKRAEVKRVLLTHIYPADEPDTLRVSACRTVYQGEVVLAQDLMELDV